MGEIIKYAVKMDSGAITYIPKFHKDWFSYSKSDREDTQIYR
jgi:hypothetical protein